MVEQCSVRLAKSDGLLVGSGCLGIEDRYTLASLLHWEDCSVGLVGTTVEVGFAAVATLQAGYRNQAARAEEVAGDVVHHMVYTAAVDLVQPDHIHMLHVPVDCTTVVSVGADSPGKTHAEDQL